MSTRTSSALALVAVIVLASCATQPEVGADEDNSPSIAPSPRIHDLTRSETAGAYTDPLPEHASPSTFVPWDSEAFLRICGDDGPAPGALVVLYGKNGQVETRGPSTIYVLAEAGPRFEPISLDWQPGSGREMRAIARVDGELRHFDFDR